MMARSWDHTIQLLTPDMHRRGRCMAGNCGQPPIYLIRWSYITRRMGRPATSQRVVCKYHGENFAHYHSLSIPSERGEP